MNYTTGQRFTAKIQGVPVEGKIAIGTNGKIYLLNNQIHGNSNHYLFITNMMGYKYAWCIGNGYEDNDSAKDLMLLPDTFDKDNWVVDIVKEKDHPRLGEFKSWYIEKGEADYFFDGIYYGLIYGTHHCKMDYSIDFNKTPLITLDTFFTHFCKEATEPKKGDLVEVSMNGEHWYKNHTYTGYQNKQGDYVTGLNDAYAAWKHIRLAKSPEQVRHDTARDEAKRWLKEYYPNDWTISSNGHYIDLITEYIKTEGK